MNKNQVWIKRGLLGGLLAGLIIVGCIGVAAVSFRVGAMRGGYGPRAIAGGRFAPQPPAVEQPADPPQPESRRGPRRIDRGDRSDGRGNGPGFRNNRGGFGMIGGLFRGVLTLGFLASLGVIGFLIVRRLQRTSATANDAPAAQQPIATAEPVEPAAQTPDAPDAPTGKPDEASDAVI